MFKKGERKGLELSEEGRRASLSCTLSPGLQVSTRSFSSKTSTERGS